jgi:hypothetical protein
VFISKRVPILGEGITCNQDPDSLHCKALKRAKSLGELKMKSLAIIRLILILSQFFSNCGIAGLSIGLINLINGLLKFELGISNDLGSLLYLPLVSGDNNFICNSSARQMPWQ